MQDPRVFQVMKPQYPEQEQLKCPRCESINTKFCYYNNYNLSQPRHFCKNCRRYWTKGGALRNIPVGGGTRKNAKRSSSSTNTKRSVSSAPAPQPHPVTPPTFTSLLQMEEFGDNVTSGPNPGLEFQNGNAQSFLSMQNGDSTYWNGATANANAWSNLAIYTPASTFQ